MKPPAWRWLGMRWADVPVRRGPWLRVEGKRGQSPVAGPCNLYYYVEYMYLWNPARGFSPRSSYAAQAN